MIVLAVVVLLHKIDTGGAAADAGAGYHGMPWDSDGPHFNLLLLVNSDYCCCCRCASFLLLLLLLLVVAVAVVATHYLLLPL